MILDLNNLYMREASKTMDEKGFNILKQLISDVEGAPFPNAINHELYTIWYEHVQRAANDALEYLNTWDSDSKSDNTIEF